MMAYITVNKGGVNMKGFSNIVEKISSGGGTILPDGVIEVKEFESTTDSNGELNIQFDNGASTSDDKICHCFN